MKAWDDFLESQETELGKETCDLWLRPLKILHFDACNLYLEVSDSFKALWFEEHVRERVLTQLFNNNNKAIKVHLSIASQSVDDKKKKKKVPSHSDAPPFKLTFDEPDPHFSFENFITVESNLVAFKILCESCGLNPETKKPKTSPCLPLFNPLYFFGKKGTGKTHLLMAAANLLKSVNRKVIFVRAETFTEHVVNAIRSGEMQIFRKTYRHCDALIIDDIEVFSRKGATQEEFFHTFNTLHVEGKQIILSSSVSPQDLKFIEPRLISRFEWGIVTHLNVLGKEEMKKVLSSHAKDLHFPLNDPISEWLIGTFGSNAKTLLRALDALILRLHMQSKKLSSLTQNDLKELLADLISEEEKSLVTPQKIIRTVAEHYGIRIDDILGKSQNRESVLPRQIAMHLCRNELKLAYMKIGDIFTRDHSTVMASVRHVEKKLEEKNGDIASALLSIQKRLVF